MANQLDEENGPIREDGKDINVIAKQIPVKVGVGSTIFEILLWLSILKLLPSFIMYEPQFLCTTTLSSLIHILSLTVVVPLSGSST